MLSLMVAVAVSQTPVSNDAALKTELDAFSSRAIVHMGSLFGIMEHLHGEANWQAKSAHDAAILLEESCSHVYDVIGTPRFSRTMERHFKRLDAELVYMRAGATTIESVPLAVEWSRLADSIEAHRAVLARLFPKLAPTAK